MKDGSGELNKITTKDKLTPEQRKKNMRSIRSADSTADTPSTAHCETYTDTERPGSEGSR